MLLSVKPLRAPPPPHYVMATVTQENLNAA